MRKFQTTVHVDGTVTKMDLGTVAVDRLDDDRTAERLRYSKLARAERFQNSADRILNVVDDAEHTIVVVRASGAVTVVHWVAD